MSNCNRCIHCEVCSFVGRESCDFYSDVIPIPDNATNGDIIRLMFPDAEVYDYAELDYKRVDFGKVKGAKNYQKISVDTDWWNAPYRKE